MSQVNTNAIYDASGGQSAKLYGVSMRNGGTAFVNRIINGDMVIDQRNAGASVTIDQTANIYVMDRWRCRGELGDGVFTCQQDSTAPTGQGFKNSAKITVTTADASIAAGQIYGFQQLIEGFNVADLDWGTAAAKTVTLSFWVRSSLTGTFGGAFSNGAFDRSYPFTYTISSANTWEQKIVTLVGDTTGTWGSTNGLGIRLNFNLGVGSTFIGTAGAWAGANYLSATGATNIIATSGATFYITGVQLEAGSVASPFERIDYGRQLIQCQRYYIKYGGTTYARHAVGIHASSIQAYAHVNFPVAMRATPSFSSGGAFGTGTPATVTSLAVDAGGTNTLVGNISIVETGATVNQPVALQSNGDSSAFTAWSSEL